MPPNSKEKPGSEKERIQELGHVDEFKRKLGDLVFKVIQAFTLFFYGFHGYHVCGLGKMVQ